MNRTTLTLVLMSLGLSAGTAPLRWIEDTHRDANPLIVALVREDPHDAVEIMRALARRPDRYVEDIMGPLLDQHSPQGHLLVESYLVTLDAQGPAAVQSWAGENPLAADRLVTTLSSQKSGYVRGVVLLICSYTRDRGRVASEVASEARRLISSTDAQAGQSEADQAFALARLFRVAEGLAEPDLALLLDELARSLRHRELSRAARRAAIASIGGDLPQRGDPEAE